VICAGSIVARSSGASAKAWVVASEAVSTATSLIQRRRLLLMSPILVGLFRRLVIAASKGCRERMPFLSLGRIEQLARFLAAHLTGQMLVVRRPRILVRALIRAAAGLAVAVGIAGRRGRWGGGWRGGGGRRLSGASRRLTGF